MAVVVAPEVPAGVANENSEVEGVAVEAAAVVVGAVANENNDEVGATAATVVTGANDGVAADEAEGKRDGAVEKPAEVGADVVDNGAPKAAGTVAVEPNAGVVDELPPNAKEELVAAGAAAVIVLVAGDPNEKEDDGCADAVVVAGAPNDNVAG